jgi:hypothetical protein
MVIFFHLQWNEPLIEKAGKRLHDVHETIRMNPFDFKEEIYELPHPQSNSLRERRVSKILKILSPSLNEDKQRNAMPASISPPHCPPFKFSHVKKYHTELNGLFFANHISKIVKTEKNLSYNLFMNSFTL